MSTQVPLTRLLYPSLSCFRCWELMVYLHSSSEDCPRKSPYPGMPGRFYSQSLRLAHSQCLMQALECSLPTGVVQFMLLSFPGTRLGREVSWNYTFASFLLPCPVSHLFSINHRNPYFKCCFQGTWLNRKLGKEGWPRKMFSKHEDTEFFINQGKVTKICLCWSGSKDKRMSIFMIVGKDNNIWEGYHLIQILKFL